ncbi:MAG: antibiotic biosynthesis monooxygenase [Dehalococcoidales bacterium]|nr:antibiotic biosynthesis monooxygenase [Dehalococcoidales bacterium]
MIKVVIERHSKDREKLASTLRELRAAAVHQSGYISGETLLSLDDKSLITVISSWRNLDDWRAWEDSKIRITINDVRIEPQTSGKTVIRKYEIMATESELPGK